MTSSLPPVIDLFAGCGGLSLGFQQAGFTVAHGYDAWGLAVENYARNLGHPASVLDLSDSQATFLELGQYERDGTFPAIVGGPPCQDFSTSGKRTEGTRADLTRVFAACVVRYRPPFFVMENVPRSVHSHAYRDAVTAMRAAGYSTGSVVLNASLYGVPQRRKRLFTIGTHSESATVAALRAIDLQRGTTPMTIREFFGDALGTEAVYVHPRSYGRRAVFTIDEPAPTVRGVNRPISATYQRHPGDSHAAHEARPFTTAERARLQTFPASYAFTGSRTNVDQMVGNAVPVALAAAVAAGVAFALASTTHTSTPAGIEPTLAVAQ